MGKMQRTSWVRFEDFSLKKLLLGVGDCDKISRREDWASGWEEEGRRFNQSRRSNKAGTYLLCSVRDAGGKRFSLVVPEGMGATSGWQLLAEKLRHLRVVAREGSKARGFVGEALSRPFQIINGAMMNGRKGKGSYVEVVTPFSFIGGESICVEVGEEDFKDKLGQMECCLVGWWEEGSFPILELEAVRKWAISSWMPKGRHNLVRLARNYYSSNLKT